MPYNPPGWNDSSSPNFLKSFYSEQDYQNYLNGSSSNAPPANIEDGNPPYQKDNADPIIVSGASNSSTLQTTGAATGSGDVFGLSPSIDSAANTIGGAVGNSITFGASSISNTLDNLFNTGAGVAGNWLLRAAFFLVGLALIIVGFSKMTDSGGGGGGSTKIVPLPL